MTDSFKFLVTEWEARRAETVKLDEQKNNLQIGGQPTATLAIVINCEPGKTRCFNKWQLESSFELLEPAVAFRSSSSCYSD